MQASDEARSWRCAHPQAHARAQSGIPLIIGLAFVALRPRQLLATDPVIICHDSSTSLLSRRRPDDGGHESCAASVSIRITGGLATLYAPRSNSSFGNLLHHEISSLFQSFRRVA